MIYYRVALRTKSSRCWVYRSDKLTSLTTLFLALRNYESLPAETVRIFFATSSKLLNDMLRRENDGLISNSISLEQLLQRNRQICLAEIKRLEEEIAPGGDHDIPYTFTLPDTMSMLLAWSRLSSRVQRGELVP